MFTVFMSNEYKLLLITVVLLAVVFNRIKDKQLKEIANNKNIL